MPDSAIVPLKLFYCYAHEDKELRDKLDAHLKLMQHQGLVKVWYDREILAGINWRDEIDTHMSEAEIILLLVSASFMASDYCYSNEMQKALQRDKAKTARVIPILLRPVDRENAPFNHLQLLPTGAKPITEWSDHNAAFENVASELRKVVKELRRTLRPNEQNIYSKTKEEWVQVGQALHAQKQYEEALTAYNNAIQLDPNFVEPYNNKGFVLYDLKRYEEALVSCDCALQLDSNCTSAYNNRGNALNGLARYEEAIAAYNQALRLYPRFAFAYSNRGNALSGLNRYEEALADYNDALRLNPKHTLAYYHKGNVLYKLKRYKDALVAYERAIHLEPEFARAYQDKGITLQCMNREREAQAAFHKAKELGYTDQET